MDFQIAVLCDSAADYGGKLCVLGTFDTILAKSVPVAHPQCSIALRVVFRKGEEGTHQMHVRIIDEDGKAVVPEIPATIQVQIPEEVFFVARNVVLNLQQMPFQRQGLHSVEINVDGHQALSLPLQVRVV